LYKVQGHTEAYPVAAVLVGTMARGSAISFAPSFTGGSAALAALLADPLTWGIAITVGGVVVLMVANEHALANAGPTLYQMGYTWEEVSFLASKGVSGTAPTTSSSSSAAALNLAQDPGKINVPIPNPANPPVPGHIKNHPRGDYTSALKEATWNEVWNRVLDGQPPDWCGTRNGVSWLIAYFGAQITTKTGKVYQGLAVLINREGGSSTAFPGRVTMTPQGPHSGNTTNDFDQFTQVPCPPGGDLATQ